MRSRFELYSPTLDRQLARTGARFTAQEIHRMAQQHRAMAIGNMIADAIVWAMGLPRRLAAWATASAPHHIQPWRS